MNIFAEKGIRDVADVTLYSINRIGTEEFYLPVLYLDSLKLTNFSKSVATNESFGGIGNRKTVSWSYTKDIKLKAEDALFTQASLSMLAAGRLAQKMSPWTSAIAKLMVANKYGCNSYSTKAYPSPELTDEEWEIVFRCAQKAGFNPRIGDIILEKNYSGGGEVVRSAAPDKSYDYTVKYLYDQDDQDNAFVAENRWLLKQGYLHRNQKTSFSQNLAPYVDISKDVQGVTILLQNSQPYGVMNFIQGSNLNDTLEYYCNCKVQYYSEEDKKNKELNCNFGAKLIHGCKGIVAEVAGISIRGGSEPEPRPRSTRAVTPSNNTDARIFYQIFPGSFMSARFTSLAIGNKEFLDNILWFLLPKNMLDAQFFATQLHGRDYSNPYCWFQTQERQCLAMPQQIIDLISDEINEIKDYGYQQNSLKEAKQIDRYTKCIVTDPCGLKIDLVEQFANIKKMYKDEKDNYIVYYDAKTMMPFAQSTFLTEDIAEQKGVSFEGRYQSEQEYLAAKKNKFLSEIQDYLLRLYGQEASEWVLSLTPNDIIITNIDEDNFIVLFLVTKRDYITLKYGTFYYKKERVIDTDDNDISFLGIDIPINYDTFKGEYLIVGDTMVKDQATGKDQPCQIVINRATISSSTTLNLSGKGESATFSFDVGILDPIDENKDAVELIFYNTEKDERNGGERIIPQSKRYARTPILKTKEEVVAANEEMY